jgi:hypothetical protein
MPAIAMRRVASLLVRLVSPQQLVDGDRTKVEPVS